MTPKIAANNLGLGLEGLTRDAVRSAFTDRLKAVHPDTASEQTAISGAMIKALQDSRDTLLQYVTDNEGLVRCDTCNGTGKQKTRSGGLIKCMTCAGAGEYRPRSFHRG